MTMHIVDHPAQPWRLDGKRGRLFSWNFLGLSILCFFLAIAPFLPVVGPPFMMAYRKISELLGPFMMCLGFTIAGFIFLAMAFAR